MADNLIERINQKTIIVKDGETVLQSLPEVLKECRDLYDLWASKRVPKTSSRVYTVETPIRIEIGVTSDEAMAAMEDLRKIYPALEFNIIRKPHFDGEIV